MKVLTAKKNAGVTLTGILLGHYVEAAEFSGDDCNHKKNQKNIHL